MFIIKVIFKIIVQNCQFRWDNPPYKISASYNQKCFVPIITYPVRKQGQAYILASERYFFKIVSVSCRSNLHTPDIIISNNVYFCPYLRTCTQIGTPAVSRKLHVGKKFQKFWVMSQSTRGDSMSYQSQIKCPHLSRGLLTFTLKVK